jgi:hypothetical protein
MENIYCKLDFDNPIFDAILVFIATSIFQYLETIHDDKKKISFQLSGFVAAIVGILIYYVVGKHLKLNISSQEIFTDMGNFK